jgi:group I intron endonuclease
MKVKKIIGIYKITSPTGRIYIGQSTDINYRWNDYKKLKCESQTKLYSSFKKHGVENHVFEIIHECTEFELNYFEIYYGNLFNVLDKEKGLNLKECGGSKGKFSEETIKRMSEAQTGEKNGMFGKTHKEESIKKQREVKIGMYDGEKNPNYGKQASTETIKRISDSLKGENNPNYGKKLSKSTTDKMSESRKGQKPFLNRKHTMESIKLMREKKKGVLKSEEAKQNMRKPKSEQHKINLKESQRKRREIELIIKQERLSMIF